MTTLPFQVKLSEIRFRIRFSHPLRTHVAECWPSETPRLNKIPRLTLHAFFAVGAVIR